MGRAGAVEAMKLMELASETAGVPGLARVKLKITGPVGADGWVDLRCVETVVDDAGRTVVLSDEVV